MRFQTLNTGIVLNFDPTHMEKVQFEYINTSVEVTKSDVSTSNMTKCEVVGGKCLSTLSTGITQ